MLLAKLSVPQCRWRVLEDFHSQEYIQLFDVNHCLFVRLHFSIGCCKRHRTSQCRHGFQFCGILTLPVYHVHRRARVHNKFSFLWFNC